MRSVVGIVCLALLLLAVLPDAPPAGAEAPAGTRGGPLWSNPEPAPRPSPRAEYALAYDSESDRVILFGGFVGAADAETWAYDLNANAWERRNPATSPPATNLAAMAYDASADLAILFGGFQTGGRSDDTWAYDYNADTWTIRNPVTRPLARTGHAMAYDAASERVVLFGGNLEFQTFADETWSYDTRNDTWTKRNPFFQPSARGLHGMAYDAGADRTILLGGTIEGPGGEVTFFPETWAYDLDGDRWEQRSPARSPTARAFFGMAYDALSARVVLFGGILPDSSRAQDTWAYDHAADNWTRLDPVARPGARTGHGLAYDAESQHLVLFGGYTASGRSDETWTYAPGISDTEPPTIAFTFPANGSSLWSPAVTVRGVASDDVALSRVEVSLDGESWTVAAGRASWSDSLVLREGPNTVYARATDTSGNVAVATLSLTVLPTGLYLGAVLAVGTLAIGTLVVWRWRRTSKSRPKGARRRPPGEG